MQIDYKNYDDLVDVIARIIHDDCYNTEDDDLEHITDFCFGIKCIGKVLKQDLLGDALNRMIYVHYKEEE